jgi:hypothetical protein
MTTTLKSLPPVVSSDSGATGAVTGTAISVTAGEISESVDSCADEVDGVG